MNPNHGLYLEVVGHAHDGCQWNPDAHRGALPSDRHFRTTRASVVIGGGLPGSIQYRLCASCAALPHWIVRQGRSLMARPIDAVKHVEKRAVEPIS